jgi:redox-sensitive bicupin YhaK (pirin superfamily)
MKREGDTGATSELGDALSARRVARIVASTPARHGSAFTAMRIGGGIFGSEGDPFLALDHFYMAGPTFPPHAHAGFSAVTYILPESRGGMLNRDSLGDRSLIPAGGVHWTAAGSGIVHEEVPDRPGVTVEGFQIFVRQPIAQERTPPVIHHVEPGNVPVVAFDGGGSARVLAGALEGVSAPFAAPSPLCLLDVTLPAGATFRWTPEWSDGGCAIYLFAGELAIDARPLGAPNVIVFERGDEAITLRAETDARLALLAGEPINAPGISNGPFTMSSEAALRDAVERYRSGAMGTLS